MPCGFPLGRVVLEFEPLAGSEDANAVVLHEDEQVFVTGDNAVGLAGDCRGEHCDIFGVTAGVSWKRSGPNELYPLGVGTKKGHIFGSDLEFLLKLFAQLIQELLRGNQDMIVQASAHQIAAQTIGDQGSN